MSDSSEQTNGEVRAASQYHQLKDAKVWESDLVESDNEISGFKKNGLKTELPPPGSEKDLMTSKIRTQTGKTRQSQSGPLMPGVVLGQSIPVRNLERFIRIYYIH